jgi:hypothetical protein
MFLFFIESGGGGVLVVVRGCLLLGSACPGQLLSIERGTARPLLPVLLHHQASNHQHAALLCRKHALTLRGTASAFFWTTCEGETSIKTARRGEKEEIPRLLVVLAKCYQEGNYGHDSQFHPSFGDYLWTLPYCVRRRRIRCQYRGIEFK